MEGNSAATFDSVTRNVGRYDLTGKTFLIPEMNRVGGHLLAATFRGFGILARVMETYRGLDLGKAVTSGKECYPCQITMGDVLYFLQKEKERLKGRFKPASYVYFMPESDGPCRFGMYNKYQRIVLDSFPELKEVKIGYLTAEDGYSLSGIVDRAKVRGLRKASYLSVLVADIMDRLLWRIRPYEREPGSADRFIEQSMREMEAAFETNGVRQRFNRILSSLEGIIDRGKAIIDPSIPPKPKIGVVGEIYLRTHVQANQDIIRLLERHGGEVVNASIAEWVNYISYDGLRDAKIGMRLGLKQFRPDLLMTHLKKWVRFGADLSYQEARQKQVYGRVRDIIDLVEDHQVARLEEVLREDDLFSFDISTESCLSIAAILRYAREGYNGVVNVYPFTCMPSVTTAAVVKPLMGKLGVPYLDSAYDSSVQPGREAAIRTFMYQAHQHHRRFAAGS